MVERLHLQLKTVLLAVEDPGNWSDNLPLALLGIRAALKSDLGCNAAELVFSSILRLPGEMITPTSRRADETPDNLPLESPYEGPFRVLALDAKTCRTLRGGKEDVVGVDRVKAAVAEEPPDLSQG
nr:unnamed protein product [Spirometra erinaceieuropaei]